MELFTNIILVIHFLLAVAICIFVLLQHGKGADLGAAFGSGASGSLFGAAGSANFLSRTTAILVTLFFLTSVTLTWFSVQSSKTPSDDGVMSTVAPVTAPAPVPQLPADVPTAPAAPVAPAAPAAPADVPTAPAPAQKASPKP